MEYSFKIILLGDYSCGKSSILKQYTDGVFENIYTSTIGVDFGKKEIYDDEHNIYKLLIWDTAGLDKFQVIIQSYFRNIAAGVLIFDLSNTNTFKSINKWKELLFKNVSDDRIDDFPLILVGNKCDLEKSREVELCEINKLIDELNCIYIECSAKNNINIEKIFDELLKQLLSKLKQKLITADNDTTFKYGIKIQSLKKKHSFTICKRKQNEKKCCIIQ